MIGSIVKGLWSASNALASIVFKIFFYLIILVIVIAILTFTAFYFGRSQGVSQEERVVKLVEEQLAEVNDGFRRSRIERDSFQELYIHFNEAFREEKATHKVTLARAESAESESRNLRVNLAITRDSIEKQKIQISDFIHFLCESETETDIMRISNVMLERGLEKSKMDFKQLEVIYRDAKVKALEIDKAKSYYQRSILFFALSFSFLTIVLLFHYHVKTENVRPIVE
ncbi:MAG: hypothetical protein AAF741_17000 [Bacteroidota bacterium]